MSNIFSKIIAGEAEADVVYRDERVTCFRDIAPKAPTHILIVPNREIATVNDLGDDDAELVGYMVLVAKRLAAEEGIAERGYRLVINCNPEGGQVVYHLHMHLVGGRPLGAVARPAG
jgi:histidine triad (HIT) family protein